MSHISTSTVLQQTERKKRNEEVILPYIKEFNLVLTRMVEKKYIMKFRNVHTQAFQPL